MNPYNKLNISDFLIQAATLPVVDVRSPVEFNAGHIPGAFNVPLFNDKEREIVGTIYKKEGRRKAVIKGLQLTGPSMFLKLEEALKLAVENKILVHCWRGGMRSEAMAWLFSLGDIETQILEGGYKSYRNHVLEKLSEKRKYMILGGLTGSGKTEILKYMKNIGHQVIDLEGIANHKGSAFGSLGQAPQPSSEHFANLLYEELVKLDKDKVIWLEDESKNIGSVFLPDKFFINLRESPVIGLMMDVKTRMPRLLKEYSLYNKEDLISSINRIAKRLGGDNTKEAITEIEKSNYSKAIEITLDYYDKTYMFGLKKRHEDKINFITTDTDEIPVNVSKIIEGAVKIVN
jgi:tRNA 2-selenouridine synthase